MTTLYYIDSSGNKTGPYDLVTLMRRARRQELHPGQAIYIDGKTLPAASIPEVARFFQAKSLPVQRLASASPFALLRAGWRFTLAHSVMTVYAGGAVLIALMFAMGLINRLGPVGGGTLAFCIYMLMQQLYLVFALRLHRGQILSADFFDRQLGAALPGLIISSLALALMTAGGMLVMIAPAMLVTALYLFTPFVIFDRRLPPVHAMEASRLLACAHPRYWPALAMLTGLHLICLLLIFPLPLTLPIFAGAVAEMYEGMGEG